MAINKNSNWSTFGGLLFSTGRRKEKEEKYGNYRPSDLGHELYSPAYRPSANTYEENISTRYLRPSIAKKNLPESNLKALRSYESR